jgi:hypothetical protein
MANFPYKDRTEKDIRAIESNYFIQLGGDFVADEGSFLFTRKEAERMYNSTLKRLIGIVQNGSEKDVRFGIDLIGTLRIVPVRLH